MDIYRGKSLMERILEKVSPHENERGCRLWLGGKCRGYGQIGVNGKTSRVTRVLWEFRNGPIAAGLDVCHSCDVPACVNLDHLFLGTRKDNMADCVAKGRIARTNASKTHCKYGHEFTEENTHRATDGRRSCRACQRRRQGVYSDAGKHRAVVRGGIERGLCPNCWMPHSEATQRCGPCREKNRLACRVWYERKKAAL